MKNYGSHHDIYEPIQCGFSGTFTMVKRCQTIHLTLHEAYKVGVAISVQISDVPSWDAETIFF